MIMISTVEGVDGAGYMEGHLLGLAVLVGLADGVLESGAADGASVVVEELEFALMGELVGIMDGTLTEEGSVSFV